MCSTWQRPNYNIVDKRGAYFRYNDILLGQGRENAKVYLAENPAMLAELERRIRRPRHAWCQAGHRGEGIASKPASSSRTARTPRTKKSIIF
jgi:hypothetical protein